MSASAWTVTLWTWQLAIWKRLCQGVLEGIITHSIPRDKCLLCVDFATYDETLLVAQLCGEQFGLPMAPAAPVRQSDRVASWQVSNMCLSYVCRRTQRH